MRIMVVDDEEISRTFMEFSILKACPNAELVSFDVPEKAVDYVKNYAVDVAFLDIIMKDMDGIELARRLVEICPKINVIFQSSSSEYMSDAFKLYASGYIVKPIHADDVKNQLSHLRNPVVSVPVKKIYAKTFGNFEVFYDSNPVKFKNAKTKELFAYLIMQKGSSVNTNQLCSILFESSCNSDSSKSYLRTLFVDLQKTLKAIGMENAFVKARNSYSINLDYIDSDYYRFLKGDKNAVELFNGQFFVQYSWAEEILGELSFRY